MMGRITTGVIVFAMGIGALVVGANISEQPRPSAVGTTVSVAPARQDVVCPGPLVTPLGGTGKDPELGGGATGVTSRTYLTGTIRPVGEGKASDAVVGAQVDRVGGGDTSGLAALTCSAPSTDQWLVAGATTVGNSARLVLSNPAGSSVEATATVYGEIGKVDSRTVAIGPNAQATVLLEGLAADVAAPVVHVTATGTGVVAALQDSRLNGFQPFGTDWATASALGEQLAIPGVGTDGSASQTATVRLLSPKDATVRLVLTTPDGAAVWEGVTALALQGGVAIEVAVPAVDVGTVTIYSDSPVVAGAIMTRTRPATSGVEGDTAQELRWIPAQLAGDDNERAAVAVGYGEQVVVYSPTAGTFTLTVANGASVASAQLKAGATAVVPISVAPGTVLTSHGPFTWTVLVADGDFIGAMAPTRTTIDSVEIAVEQRRYVPIP